MSIDEKWKIKDATLHALKFFRKEMPLVVDEAYASEPKKKKQTLYEGKIQENQIKTNRHCSKW